MTWEGNDQTAKDPEEQKVLYGALDSFYQYAKVAHFNTTHVRRQSFYALPREHSALLARPPFLFLDTLNAVDDCIDKNSELATAILHAGLQSSGVSNELDDKAVNEWQGKATANDMDKARSTLRQFYRDWSEEGRAERAACYQPVIQVLQQERRARTNAPPLKVLVPGAGLGRLVFDLCYLGFDTEGNEISFHQLLASSYILNTCPKEKFHTLYPWVQSFSNHKNRKNQLKSILIPDVHPGTILDQARQPGKMTMTASDFLCLYGSEDSKNTFDAVAAVFFLDTAPNVIRYLEAIRNCLKSGGLLINIGPLLWHFENNSPGAHGKQESKGEEHSHKEGGSNVAYSRGDDQGIGEPGSFELTDDEVVGLVERMGFTILRREGGIIAPYIHDPESMLQTVYKASYWVARKI